MSQTPALSSDFVPPQQKYLNLESYTSPFFLDHQQEAYQIQQAFVSNNYTYLRSIPTHIKRGAILQDRKKKVEQMTGNAAEERSKPYLQKQQERNQRIRNKKMQQIGSLGYFQVFPYQPSEYDITNQIKTNEREKAKQKQNIISELDFRPAGFDKKAKYEDTFAYVDRIQGATTQNQLFPFHLREDTYDRFHQSTMRTKIIENNAKIAGDFIPSQQQQSLTKVNRSKSKEILQELQLFIRKYFNDLAFFLGMDKKDHIDFLFQGKQSVNVKLATLMSKICENQFLSKFMLKRNKDRWGKIDQNGYLVFGLLPPWVRQPQESLKK